MGATRRGLRRALIGGPKGSMIVPLDYDWHLLAGDATAAPAIGRRFAELPRDSEVIVVVQLEDLAVLELDRSQARVELRRAASSGDRRRRRCRDRGTSPPAGIRLCLVRG